MKQNRFLAQGVNNQFERKGDEAMMAEPLSVLHFFCLWTDAQAENVRQTSGR